MRLPVQAVFSVCTIYSFDFFPVQKLLLGACKRPVNVVCIAIPDLYALGAMMLQPVALDYLPVAMIYLPEIVVPILTEESVYFFFSLIKDQ